MVVRPIQLLRISRAGFLSVFVATLLFAFLLESHVSNAYAQSSPGAHKRFEIKDVSPSFADPGAVIEIIVAINLDTLQAASDAKVFFDDADATVVGVNYKTGEIRAQVPVGLKAGSTPLIVVRIGDDTSFPYPAFRVSPTLLQRLTELYAAPLQFAGIFILVLSVFATIMLLARIRSRERLVKEQAKLYETITRRRREGPTSPYSSGLTVSEAPESTGKYVPIVTPSDQLIRACINNECVLFAGAGFPAEFGAPTSAALVATLLESARDRLPTPYLEAIQLALDEGEVESAKDLLSAKLEPRFIQQVLSRSLKTFAPSGQILESLRRIGFAGVITTNWDDGLNQIFMPRLRGATLSAPGLSQTSDFFLFRALGDPSEKQFAFTFQDYRELVADTPQISRFLSSIFSRHSILYLGCSVDEIEQYILQSQIRAHTDRQHYALVRASPLIEVHRSRMLARYHIELIVCEPGDGEAISLFLRELRSRLPTTPRIARAAGVKPKIDELTLINIGPFKEAVINFEKSNAIFLGNNGSGKSTALKAIALALCGDDDRIRDRVNNLLREPGENEDEMRGSIEIRSGKERYRTELFRDRNRIVARARQPSPLQDGSWVAFGFPAVRGILSRTSERRMSRFPGPVVDDVLPLLGNGLDSRLDDLKQWVIDVHNKSEDSSVAAAERDKARRLRDALFDIIDHITPGFDIKFHHFDHDARQIWVRTSDGILPLEMLSQGISSTIGWAGTLLTRLFDIYDSSLDPAKEPALLLIDEIDSHLHPAWQQVILRTTAELFPNLSIVATTHSPLIVGSLENADIIRFSRTSDGIHVEPIRQSYRGYRADQILTDAPFRLTTSRDPSLETVAAPLRAEFAKLARKLRTPEEDKRLRDVAHRLETALPASGETPVERAAVEEREALYARLLDPEVDVEALLASLNRAEDPRFG